VIRSHKTMFLHIAGTLASFLTAGVLFPLPSASQPSKAAAEYLIVEHCDQLLIYNKYQQRMNRQEKEAFIPFVPLRILDSRGVLNDNYTPCMKVELDGSIFYLIKNDRTTLMGEGKIGLNQIYRNVILVQDTVQLMTKRSAVLISPDYTQRIALRKSEKLVRYFQKGDLTYIRSLGAPMRFGWARLDGMVRALPPQSKEEDAMKNPGVPDKTLERVHMKFNEVNTVLAHVFMYFNNQSSLKKSIPQWHSAESEGGIAYVLEPHVFGSHFPESDRYLLRDLDNILFGTVYSLIYSPGKIEIQRK
jgi:hypothetical protein